jgi:transposase-like protein
MSTRTHRHWTAEEKLRILEEARQAGQSVSEVCRRHQIAPGQFYAWERLARQGALEALRHSRRGRKTQDPTAYLQAEVERFRNVVAELSAENLSLKRGRWP